MREVSTNVWLRPQCQVLMSHTYAAGAMSMFKTQQLKAIIYEFHLCLYKDESNFHKLVPLLGAEVHLDSKKDTKFCIITAKNKTFEVIINVLTETIHASDTIVLLS